MNTVSPVVEARAVPVQPARAELSPLAVSDVVLDPTGFWGTRREVNRDATLTHCLEWLERAGWLGNFDAAASGTLPGARRGREFSDSEVYKLIEAWSWQYGVTRDPHLDQTIRALTSRVAQAQEPDGYLNTNFGRAGQRPRYCDLEWGHELYNYGHLLQAAVARSRTAGRDQLFDVAERVADHVCDTFGEDGLAGVCGHPEIELGLVEFGRLTGRRRYLDQARIFVERRGRGTLADIEWGRAYFQDDVPIRDATVLRGHAVRALYLAAAAVDIAVDTDEPDLLQSIERQWANTVARRTYITGGMGSRHQDEAFGDDYVLPSDRAYCETCAGVASAMLSWRLLLATGNPKYADLIERTLYNIVATSPSPDGRAFFYTNTLHQRVPGTVAAPDTQSPRASSSLRAPWFDVSCCPTNVARMLASLTGYLATSTADGLQLHQYASGTIHARLADDQEVAVRVETAYPSGGEIAVTILRTAARPWVLSLRVPAWATEATLEQAGSSEPVSPGTVALSRSFTVGETVTLRLPTAPRYTFPDPRIDAIRSTVAVESGPVVYCVESIDLPAGRHADDIRVDPTQPLRSTDGQVSVSGTLVEDGSTSWPYRIENRAETANEPPRNVRLTPYHEWANRGPSSMRIWLPLAATSGRAADAAQDSA